MSKSVIIKSILILIVCTYPADFLKANHILGPKDSQGKANHINTEELPIYKFDSIKSKVLMQYLLGNPGWEYKIFRGKEYFEKTNCSDQNFATLLKDSIQSKIKTETCIISFGPELGISNTEHITFSKPKTPVSKLKIFPTYSGNQRFESSYLIIRSNHINIEITEHRTEKDRKYTQPTIDELSSELETILLHINHISDFGVMPSTEYYPCKYSSPFFEVSDTKLSGFYSIEAAFPIDKEGYTFIKVCHESGNTSIGKGNFRLSSMRRIGWSSKGNNIFHYSTKVKIYGIGASQAKKARFELWFKDLEGNEHKLDVYNKTIKGWDRRGNISANTNLDKF